MQQQPPEKLKKLLVFHLAFFGGALILTLICFVLKVLGVVSPLITGYHGEAILVSAMFSLISFLTARLIYLRKLKIIRKLEVDLEEKLDLLMNAELSRWILLAAGILFCVVSFLVAGEIDIFILILGLLLVLYLTRPTAVNIASDLKVREADIMNLQ